jgi:hypothetical protein
VPEVTDKYAYEVDASYKLGDRPINAKFEIDDSSGHYLVGDGYAEVDLSYTAKGLPLTINGVTASADKVYLFPGSYELATTAKYITLGSGANFLVQQPNDYPDIQAKPALTPAGQKVFKQRVTAAINKCIASTKLKAGCGLDLASKTTNGYTVKDGTVHRSLTSDAKAQVRNLKAELDYESPTVAEASSFYASVDTSATLRKGKQTGRADLWGSGTSFDTPQIDMSDRNLTVEWD